MCLIPGAVPDQGGIVRLARFLPHSSHDVSQDPAGQISVRMWLGRGQISRAKMMGATETGSSTLAV